MTTVTVRDARPEDLDALLSLYHQLAEDRFESRPAGRPATAALLQAISMQPGRSLLVAAIDRPTADRAPTDRSAAARSGAETTIVGTADLLVVPNLTHQGMPWAIVENVVVDESCRRLGVGRALMEAVVDRCREAGCYKVQLLSRTHRLGAHDFYARIGFEASATGFRRHLR
jgi:GNAT superfamily N-acetyltransferase